MLHLPPGRADSPAPPPGTPQRKPLKQWFHRKHLVFLGLLAVAMLMLACDADARQSTFGTAGPVAEKQLLLFNVLLWVMVAVFILVEGALVYAAIKFRRRPGQGLPKQVHGNTPLEITWTVIPTILILALGGWSVITLFELERPPVSADNPILEITVTGHQWWWEFEYHDADGNGKIITTANELKIPVGRPVEVLLQSDDVIHSFWVPKLAGKVDVVPTRNNRMWFQADETGIFYAQCAEFCGIAHAQMKFIVESLTKDEYDSWVAGWGELPRLSPQASQGQSIFNGVGGCVVCHTANGIDLPAVVDGRVAGFLASDVGLAPGPNLTDLASRTTFAAGIEDLNRENLRRWLTDPEQVKPGNFMSDRATIYQTADGRSSLSQQEITLLIEYLLSLK